VTTTMVTMTASNCDSERDALVRIMTRLAVEVSCSLSRLL
jgi:hypothetical protein